MKIFKQISLYTFVSFLGAGINFFLMPYLSHFIEPAEYGTLSILNSYVTILIPLVGLVASSLVFVEYYRIKDKKEFASLFTSVQLIPLVPAGICLLLTLLFPGTIASFLELPTGKEHWLYIVILLSVLTIYFETLILFNVSEKKPGHYAFFNILKLVVEVSLTIWFVSGLRMGWEGRMWSWVISTGLLSLVSIIYFRKQGLLTTNISTRYIRAGILFGLPLILHTVGKFVINQSNRLFIAKMVSVDEAGIYNIGAQVGMVLLLLVNAVGNFYQPFLYERLAQPTEEGKRQIVKTTYLVAGFLALALVFLTVLTPTFFTILVDPKYAKGMNYVFWVGLGYFFWGIYILFSGFIFYEKETKFLGLIALINVTLSILLNYILIQAYGAIGAAYASCISFLVIAAIVAWKAMQLFELPWAGIWNRRLSNHTP